MVQTPTHSSIARIVRDRLVAKPGQAMDSGHNLSQSLAAAVKVSSGKSLNSGPSRRFHVCRRAGFNAVTNRNYILISSSLMHGAPARDPQGRGPVATAMLTAVAAEATINRQCSFKALHDARIVFRVNRVRARGAWVGGCAGAMLRVSGERTYHADV